MLPVSSAVQGTGHEDSRHFRRASCQPFAYLPVGADPRGVCASELSVPRFITRGRDFNGDPSVAFLVRLRRIGYRFVLTVTMADSASESDSSSIDGGPIMMPPSPITREQMQKRIDSLQQQNRVLKVELETYKLKMKAMDEECKRLRETSVYIVSVISLPCIVVRRTSVRFKIFCFTFYRVLRTNWHNPVFGIQFFIKLFSKSLLLKFPCVI